MTIRSLQARLRYQRMTGTCAGYGIVFDGAETGVCVSAGCRSGHPFIMTPSFTFGNSDGSTDDDAFDLNVPAFTPKQILFRLMNDITTYIYEQVH